MLYRPEAFEPLTSEPWDAERVGSAIRAIVADADERFDPDGLWPGNEWDLWESTEPLKDLYVGAGGVLFGLDVLRRRGLADTAIDLAAAARRTLELGRIEPDLDGIAADLPAQRACSLLCGEGGLLLVAWRLGADQELADALLERVRENVDNETDGLMWGSPGTMLAARQMGAWTGEERWEEAWRESSEALLARRGPDGIWTQRLYGGTHRQLGPVHGLVGNVHVLLQGGYEELRAETAAILAREAVVEDGLANWPALVGEGLEQDDQIRLQWCSGAPGIVATAAPYIDEELLLAGAELIWRAGAHGEEKGASLCHGTAGNGFALLMAFGRTGDERWLERARRFAVHALGQAERTRARAGRGRYSLFTGDLGVALFAAACLHADARFPVLEAWD
ncbi:MAG TPA: lanthionine synthetase LanC family protein [Gaiellaceae bacterium]|nr:lanthionine synthetase LanC family protein [Gaiellaceae bacterium]